MWLVMPAMRPYWMRALADPLPGSVAADFITITSAYRHMYWTVPPAQLHDAVATHVRLGIVLVASVPEAARRSLAAAVSESSLLAGRIEFFDTQNPQEAQQSFVVALQAAQEAHDSLSLLCAPSPLGVQAETRLKILECFPVVSPWAMTAPNTDEKVCRGIPSQSAHVPYSLDSSTSVSPTSNTTALITPISCSKTPTAGNKIPGP